MSFDGHNYNPYPQFNYYDYEKNMPMESGYMTGNTMLPYTTYPYHHSQVYQAPHGNHSVTSKPKPFTPLDVIDPKSHTVLDFNNIKHNSEKRKPTNLLDEISDSCDIETTQTLSNGSLENNDIVTIQETKSLVPSSKDIKQNYFEMPSKDIEQNCFETLSKDIKQNYFETPNKDIKQNCFETPSKDIKQNCLIVTDLLQEAKISKSNKIKSRLIYKRNKLIKLGDQLCENGTVRCDKLDKLKFIDILSLKTQLKEIIEMLKRRTVVELSRSSNSYIPPRLRINDACSTNDSLNKFRRSFRAILNKIAPQNFKQCAQEILEFAKVTNESKDVEINDMVSCLIEEIFDKAVKQEGYSVTYAQLCSAFKQHEDCLESTVKWNFKTLLLERCKQMFETPLQDQLDRVREYFHNKADEQKDHKLKKLYLDDIEEQIKNEKDKYFGNIRFIGELYIHQLLNPSIIYNCVKTLIPKCETDEAASKSVCKLLATVGKRFNTDHSDKMTEIVHSLKEVHDKLYAQKTNTRVRFEIKDILEMSERNWTLRAVQQEKLVQPKTFDQLQHEKVKEEKDKEVMIQNFKRSNINSSNLNQRNFNNSNFLMKQSSSASELRAKSIQQQQQNHHKTIEVSNLAQTAPATDSVEDICLKPAYTSRKWGLGSGEKADKAVSDNAEWKPVSKSRSKFNSKNKTSINQSSSFTSSTARASAPLPNAESTKSSKTRMNNKTNSFAAKTSKFSGISDLDQSDECNSTSEDGSSVGITMNIPSKHDSPSVNEELLPEEVSEKNMKETLFSSGTINKKYWSMLPNHASFICCCLNDMLDMDKTCRDHVAHGFAHLISEGVLDQQIFIDGLKEFEPLIEDILTDVPKLWSHLSEFFGHLLNSNLSIDDFSTIFHTAFTDSMHTFKILLECLLETVNLSKKRVTLDWLLTTISKDRNKDNEELARQIITEMGADNLVQQTTGESLVKNNMDNDLKRDIKELLLSKNEEELYVLLESKYSPDQMQTEQFVKFIFLCLLEFICETPDLNVVEFLDSMLLFCKRQIDNKAKYEKQVLSVISDIAPRLLDKDLLETVISYIFRHRILSEEAYHQFIQSNSSQTGSIGLDNPHYLGMHKTVEVIKSFLSDNNSSLDSNIC